MEVSMTHDDIINFFGSNKNAVSALGYSQVAISKARIERPTSVFQIRAHHVSRGVLKMDEEAKEYFDFLTAKDVKRKRAKKAA